MLETATVQTVIVQTVTVQTATAQATIPVEMQTHHPVITQAI